MSNLDPDLTTLSMQHVHYSLVIWEDSGKIKSTSHIKYILETHFLFT